MGDNGSDRYFCIKCGEQEANNNTVVLKGVEVYEFFCTNCYETWFICKDCPSLKEPKKSMASMKRHIERSCKKRKMMQRNATENMDEEVDIFKADAENNSMNIRNVQSNREANELYYTASDQGKGAESIVCLSQFGERTSSESVNDKKVACMLQLTKVLVYMSRTSSEVLLSFLKLLLDMYGIDDSTVSSLNKGFFRLPKTRADIRRVFLEGPNSVFQNVPHPPPREIDGHCVFGVKEIVHFAMRTEEDIGLISQSEYDQFRDAKFVKNVFYSFRLDDMVDDIAKGIFVLPFIIFSDDVDPNKSNKSNRGGIWICIGTFGGLKRTYLIALGTKGKDHREVEKLILDEMNQIDGSSNSIFFSKRLGRSVPVKIHLYARLGDNPERHDVNSIVRGNGTWTSRWGYLCNPHENLQAVPACSNCFQNNLTKVNEWNKLICYECVNWDFGNDTLGLLHSTPPKYFPMDAPVLVGGKIPSREYQFTDTIQACELTFVKVSEGKWSSKQGSVFLEVHGVRDYLINEIITNADNSFMWKNREKIQILSEDQYVMLLDEHASSPSNFLLPPLPPTWYPPYSRSKFIDAIMHLLSLGITESVNQTIMQWLSAKEKRAPMLRSISQRFNPIVSLRLEHHKALDHITPKWGGWVSENWLFMGRVMKWVYAIADDIAKEKEFPQPPGNDPCLWTGKQINNWLKARNL